MTKCEKAEVGLIRVHCTSLCSLIELSVLMYNVPTEECGGQVNTLNMCYWSDVAGLITLLEKATVRE